MWLDIFDAPSIRHLNQIAIAMLHFAVARLPQRQKWHANCFILGHHRGACILVDDPPLNKISRRTALALPLALAASSSTIFNSLAKADQPVPARTIVLIVQPDPSTLAHY